MKADESYNVLTEALALKEKEVSRSLKSRLPFFFGSTYKAVRVGWHAKAARQAAERGDYEGVYKALGIEDRISQSKILNTAASKIDQQAQDIMLAAGYTLEKQDQFDTVSSLTDTRDQVKKLEGEQATVVKDSLNNLFNSIFDMDRSNPEAAKAAKDAAIKAYNESIENLPPHLKTSLQQMRERTITLAEENAGNQEYKDAYQQYVNEHDTYVADIKHLGEGVQTKQKRDSVVWAAAAGGSVLAGSIVIATWLGRTQVFSRVVKQLAGPVSGLVTGFVYSSLRGRSRAAQELSEFELQHANVTQAAPAPDAAEGGETPASEEAAEGETPASESDVEDGAEDEAAAPEASSEPAAGEEEMIQKNKITRGLMGWVRGFDSFKRNRVNSISQKKYGTDTLFEALEQKLDRQTAKSRIERMSEIETQFAANESETGQTEQRKALERYALETLSLLRASQLYQTDYIQYDAENHRGKLETELAAALRIASGEGDDFNLSEYLQQLDQNQEEGTPGAIFKEMMGKRAQNHQEAQEIRNAYIRRTALVEGVAGAITGAATGLLWNAALNIPIVQQVRDWAVGTIVNPFINWAEGTFGFGDRTPNGQDPHIQELLEQVQEGKADLVPHLNEDGTYDYYVGDELVLDDIGYQVDPNTGVLSITADTLTNLRENGFDESIISFDSESVSVPDVQRSITLDELLNPNGSSDPEIAQYMQEYNVTRINGYDWPATDGDVILHDVYADQDGNFVIHVVSQDPNINPDDLQLALSSNNGANSAFMFDVNENNDVIIPHDSPAAAFIQYTNGPDSGPVLCGTADVGQMGDGNMFHSLAHDGLGLGNRGLDVDGVYVTDHNAQMMQTVLKIGGTTVQVPEEVRDHSFEIFRDNRFETLGNDEPAVFEYSETETFTINVQTPDGSIRTVDIHALENYEGGYSALEDTFYSPDKLVTGASTRSIVEILLENHDVNTDGMSVEAADALLIDKLNSGEISYDEYVHTFFETIAKSPEALVTFRASIDPGFQIDELDGPIDTEAEINDAADILPRSPERYSELVQSTFDYFKQRISGGYMNLIDLVQHQYSFTSFGTRGSDGNVLQHIGVAINRHTNGLGTMFIDKDGNNICSGNSAWRDDCGQKVGWGEEAEEALGLKSQPTGGTRTATTTTSTSTTTTTTTSTKPSIETDKPEDETGNKPEDETNPEKPTDEPVPPPDKKINEKLGSEKGDNEKTGIETVPKGPVNPIEGTDVRTTTGQSSVSDDAIDFGGGSAGDADTHEPGTNVGQGGKVPLGGTYGNGTDNGGTNEWATSANDASTNNGIAAGGDDIAITPADDLSDAGSAGGTNPGDRPIV